MPVIDSSRYIINSPGNGCIITENEPAAVSYSSQTAFDDRIRNLTYTGWLADLHTFVTTDTPSAADVETWVLANLPMSD
jgi:hypothetical protein